MDDPFFHEAWEAYNTGYVYYTSVGSLNAMAAYSMNQACENSVRGIWKKVTGESFPYSEFNHPHKPATHVTNIGLCPFYSNKTQIYLGKLTGYGLDELRYEYSQAFIDHTKPISGHRAKEITECTERFLKETEGLSNDPRAAKLITEYQHKLKNK